MKMIAKHLKFGALEVKLSDDHFFKIGLWYFPMFQKGGKYH